jgi:ferritin-like metal-binding protein YciE
MQAASFRQLYINELRDLYSAEIQVAKALPRMAQAVSKNELRQAFEEHLRETSGHVSRLEQIFEELQEKPTGKKSVGMEGLIKMGSEIMHEDYRDEVLDAALVGAAQRVAHYQIAAYDTARAFAELMGANRHASLLAGTLREEAQTGKMLTELSREINARAGQTNKRSTEPAAAEAGKFKSGRAA